MPISCSLPKFNFAPVLGGLLVTLLCLQMPSSFAEDISLTNEAPADILTPSNIIKQDEFLPVTEAYKLVGSILPTESNRKTLRLTWAIAPKYYLYLDRFKFKAIPELKLTPTYSPGIPKFDEFSGKEVTVFHDQVNVDFAIPAKTTAFDLRITFQGCAEAGLCYPPHTQFLHIDPIEGTATPTAAVTIPEPVAKPAPTEPAEKIWLWQALLFAFLGGMILNLMPCVFPVLSIKLFSLAQADKERLRLHGWAYTLGILLCFVGFASILLIAKNGGEAIGWGFQLQSPGLITTLCYLFFVMGLSMSGLIHFGTSMMGAGQSLTQKSGLTGSFFTGILAAVVASPCTAPFMGAALGFALTQPAFVCLSVFAALGMGMAFPLLLLCFLPNLAERLPRPGLWMETLKELLAFPLYLSSIWLLWVLTNQGGTNLMAAVCAGAVAISFACWINNRPASGFAAKRNKVLAVIAIALAIWMPYKLLKKVDEVSRWQPYTPELLAELRAQGRPVFVDLTADWCITCLANESTTLSKPEIEALFDEYNVVTLKGDWTNRDPKISALLSEYGRSGVPLYLYFPKNREGKADLLPQILRPSIVINAIKAEKP